MNRNIYNIDNISDNILDAVGLILSKFTENGPSVEELLMLIEDWKFNSGWRRISLDAVRGFAIEDVVDFSVNVVNGVLNNFAGVANTLNEDLCLLLSFELATLSFSI